MRAFRYVFVVVVLFSVLGFLIVTDSGEAGKASISKTGLQTQLRHLDEIGDIIITEIMPNPAAVADADGEWFEVYNTTDAAIDMDGYILHDNGGTYTISGAAVVASHDYFIFCCNETLATNGGVPTDYEYPYSYPDGLQLSNSGDVVKICTPADVIIDSVDYDGAWPYGTGFSMQLEDVALDNDVSANWCASLNQWAGSAGDAGTPDSPVDCASVPPIDLTICQARTEDACADLYYLDSLITVRGVVSFADDCQHIAYMQDGGCGIAVYGYAVSDTLLPPDRQMRAGDSLEVTGYLDSYTGLAEIVYAFDYEVEVTLIDSDKVVTITDLDCALISDAADAGADSCTGESYESEKVRVSEIEFVAAGTFVGNTNYQATCSGGDTIQIRIHYCSDFVDQPIPEGPQTVVGILGQYDWSVCQCQGYQVLPMEIDCTVDDAEWITRLGVDNEGNPACGASYAFAYSLVMDGDTSVGCSHSAFKDPREIPDWQGWTAIDQSGAGNYAHLAYAYSEFDSSLVNQNFQDYVVSFHNPATNSFPAEYDVFLEGPVIAPETYSCVPEPQYQQWFFRTTLVHELSPDDTLEAYVRYRVDPAGPEGWEPWTELPPVFLSGTGQTEIKVPLPVDTQPGTPDSIQTGVGLRTGPQEVEGEVAGDNASNEVGDKEKEVGCNVKEDLIPDISQDPQDKKYKPGPPEQHPNRRGGTCWAAAMANCFWYWSAEYPSIVGNLTGTDVQKMQKLAEELAVEIYDKKANSSEGITDFMKNKEVLHKKGDDPEKLKYASKDYKANALIYWNDIKALLDQCVDVILMIEFLDENGDPITDSAGNTIYHHITVSHMSDAADGKAKIKYSNPWDATRGAGNSVEADVTIDANGITSSDQKFRRIGMGEKSIRIVRTDLIHKPSQRGGGGGNLVCRDFSRTLDSDVMYEYTAFAPEYFETPVYTVGLYLDVPFTGTSSPPGWTPVPFPTYWPGFDDCIHEFKGEGLIWVTETDPIAQGDSLAGFGVTVDDGYPYTESGIAGFVMSDSSVEYSAFALDGPVSLLAPQVVITPSGSNIVLTWDPVEEAASYNVYTSNSPEDPWSFLDATTDTSYTHVNAITSNTKLFYQITTSSE